MSKVIDAAVLLRTNALFANMPASVIDELAAMCANRRLDAGEVLFQKGDSGTAMYGVRRGQIKIEAGTAEGARVTLNFLGAGDVFGEIALLDGQQRTADAVAVEPTELFVLRRDDMIGYLKREPTVAIKLIELLCKRIRYISDQMEDAITLPLEVRLARKLNVLAADFGSEIQISQEQLAAYVGVTRESVNRQLQIWRRQGVIELGRGRVLIKDLAALGVNAEATD